MRILLSLFLCSGVFAASFDYVTITVTNAPTTNGQTLTVDGQVYRFTNNTANLPLKILTNTTIGGSATNIISALNATLPADVQGGAYSYQGTNVILRSRPGTTLPTTIGGSWGYVTTDPMEATNAPIIQVPATTWPTPARTNNLTQLLNDIAAYASNRLATNAFFLENYISTGPDVRTLLNDIFSAGLVTGSGISNSFLTNITRANIGAAHLTNARVMTLTGPATNAGGIINAALTNATGEFRNGYLSNAIADGLIATNFSAPGSGLNSTKIGPGSIASGDYSVAVGLNNTASGLASSAIGGANEAAGDFSIALGSGNQAFGDWSFAGGESSVAQGDGSFAFGLSVTAQNDGSFVFGSGVTDDYAGQAKWGTDFYITGFMRAEGGYSNSVFKGTNLWSGSLVYTPRTLSSLADGYNSAVLLGTAVVVRISGPSGAYTNAGFVAEANGSYKLLQFDNPTSSMTILNDSGLEAVAANRVLTGTGGLLNYTSNPAFVPLIYDTTVSRWRLVR